MSLVELIPTVRSLSRSDKLQLFQWLAGDLAESVDVSPNPEDRKDLALGDDVVASREAEKVRAALQAMGLGHVVNLTAREESFPNPIHSIPIWLPDESYEAAAMMLKALEEEKSTS